MKRALTTTLLALCLIVFFGVVGIAVSTNDRLYERAAISDSTHRNMFRTPACDRVFCEVEGTTYPLGTLVRLHHETAAYVLGLSSTLPASPTRGAFYTDEEAAYLTQARNALRLAYAIGIAALIIAIAVVFPQRRHAPRAVMSAAVAATVVSVLALGAALVFPPPSWLMFDGRFNIAHLYPAGYGKDLAMWAALTSLTLSLIMVMLMLIAARGATARLAHPVRATSA